MESALRPGEKVGEGFLKQEKPRKTVERSRETKGTTTWFDYVLFHIVSFFTPHAGVMGCGAAEATGLGFVGVMGCGAAEATGLGFVCFVVINPCVLSANRVDFGLFCFINFPIYPPPPGYKGCISIAVAAENRVPAQAQRLTRYGEG